MNDEDWLIKFVQFLGYEFESESEIMFASAFKEYRKVYTSNMNSVEIITVYSLDSNNYIDNYLISTKNKHDGSSETEIIFDDKNHLFSHFKQELRQKKLKKILDLQ
jgi:hypothetical protein